uniref:Putative scylla n=1 Tax=Corethrella appendiculata TaxID=1370023 RepID=U5ETA3_9DIPT
MIKKINKIDEVFEELMKMEVLSVQNQFQNQFGVLGTSKVQDWTSPLTPPPTTKSNSNSISTKTNLHHHNRHLHHQRQINNNQNTNNNNNSSATNNNNINNQITEPIILTTSPHEDALQALSLRLQNELRAAKSRHLACTEVLLPADLLPRVASEMFIMSEKEPCGIRGCSVFIEFEDEPGNTRRIASLKTDPSTVSTFELYLTLKHDRSGWTSILPQFLKNLARGSTIMISPEFTLTKNKLYRSFSE